jgi:hypothetical protein
MTAPGTESPDCSVSRPESAPAAIWALAAAPAAPHNAAMKTHHTRGLTIRPSFEKCNPHRTVNQIGSNRLNPIYYLSNRQETGL